MGPASVAQVDENLDALARGALTPEEATWMRVRGAPCTAEMIRSSISAALR